MMTTTRGQDSQPVHLVRIPDDGVTEQLVIFADRAVLEQVQPTDRVLDIGCGRGVFSERMAALGARVTGVDIVPEEIEAARSNHSGVEYLCMAAENLDQLEVTFDLAVSRYCFHHLDFPKAAESIQACLKPGGRLFVVDCYQRFWSVFGRVYVLWSAFWVLGAIRFLRVVANLGYFFEPERKAHVRSDISRLRAQRRYTFPEVCSFYAHHFPGCVVERLGCAFQLTWQKPLRP